MVEPSQEMDRQAAALDAAVTSYLATLLAVAGTMFRQCPQVGVVHQDRLIRLRRRLAFDASPQALAESQVEVESLLNEYGNRANEYIERIWRDVVDVLRQVTRMSETLVIRHNFYSSRLMQFAEQMQASQLPADPEQLEETLALQAEGLRECVQSMNAELEELLTGFRREVHQLASRLAESRSATLIDAVTGLVNRAEVERTLAAELESPKPFCVLLFEIADFSSIVARYGPAAANDLLKQFGTRLVEQVRPRDIVGRWSENVFSVVFRCRRQNALGRAEHISRWLSDSYTIQGHVERIPVIAVAEVVEPEAGANARELFEQLDAAVGAALR